MDNHPIPQDVTHFQFKLIGNLTLKQFGYVGAGGISAWIAISTGAPFIIKLLIAMALAGAGLFFAFVPVEGRPADLMLTYFFKALFQPNQYMFQKENGSGQSVVQQRPVTPTVTAQPMMAQQPNAMPSGMPMMPSLQPTPQTNFQPNQPAFPSPLQQPPAKKIEEAPVAAQKSPLDIPAIPTTPPVTSPLDVHIEQVKPAPAPQPMKPTVTPMQVQTPKPVAPAIPVVEKPVMPPAPTPAPVAIPARETATMPVVAPVQTQPMAVQPKENPALQQELQNTLAQKKQLEEQLEALKKLLEQKAQQPAPVVAAAPVQTPAQPAPVGVSPVIKTIPVAPKVSQAPMVSDFPNIIMGVVKDARGNVLPNILIEVKDTDDNPVRAFKTNQLGQFASATPLLNGTYTILFEDPAKTHNFDAIQIEVIGEIMQPVEVISHDQREDLRKELFG